MHQASSSVAVPVEPPVQTGPVEIPQQLAAVKERVLDPDPEFRHYEKSSSLKRVKGLVNYQFAVGDQPHPPDVVFERLRWGGQFVYVSDRKRDVAGLPAQFAERGFVTVHGPAFVRTGWGIPLISRKAHFFIARKTLLVPPREFSDRFTYQVELERRNIESDGAPGTENWVVRKEIPAFERILARLKFKAPQLPQTTLERRAQKFAEQIFPLFLTREAAMLHIIERDCPRQYLNRFPRIVHMEKDGKGYVRRLWTTWLRNGGRQLTQIDFAKQAAELLHVLHERVGIIHLDLRMDNMVITEHGVGFIDFGSAVRVNENIHGNAVLSTLFGELMRTSQIQRMMDRMATAGSLTSHAIREAYQRVDKQVDLFYLAVQMSQPASSPELRDLIRYEKFSPEAMELARLTNEILRPPKPDRPRYRTARDVLQEILRIEADLKSGRFQQPPKQEAAPSKPKVYIWR